MCQVWCSAWVTKLVQGHPAESGWRRTLQEKKCSDVHRSSTGVGTEHRGAGQKTGAWFEHLGGDRFTWSGYF